MGKAKVIGMLLMVAAMLSLAPTVLAQPSVSAFYGTVKAGGANVNSGTIVRAYIDGFLYASSTTTMDGANSVYTISLGGSDAVVGKSVFFTIGGVTAAESGIYRQGNNAGVNLTFAALPLTGDADVTAVWAGLAAMGALALGGGLLLLRRSRRPV
ncbi:MAG: LPXTG cell wall anchor domain-containing protein [Dehalococcoidia bacterium]|nr:LPXTG cell wall anchor domain-containing protein [Dehalococcoidia bacterium]